MSEKTKTTEPVKQEGDFKIKSKTKVKKFTEKKEEPVKVDLTKDPNVKAEEPIKVDLTQKKEETDAIQIGETEKVSVEEPSGDSAEVGEPVQESNEDVEGFSPIKEVEVAKVEAEVKEALRDEKVLGKPLPENIEKLVSFMEETGGNISDYVRLNADYSSVDNETLLKEYYKKTKPYLEGDDISLMLEDFSYDEDIDEQRDIRKKKLAFKEEVAKARNFLEETKSKYYDEIKLRPGVTQDQQKATDFFNRYNEEQKAGKAKHSEFLKRTNELLTDDFKGFDFNVGESKFRYSVKNPQKVAEAQSDISNFIGTFLNDKGEVKDTKGYHKALYAARNADTIAQHFYEQGKADAVRDVMVKSKNISTEPRKTSGGDVFINGLKVKAISGADSTKLKVKTRKFN